MSDFIIGFQIFILTCAGFCLGYGCKTYVCNDNSDNRISFIEQELDEIIEDTNRERRRSRDYLQTLSNFQQVEAVVVQPSAPPVVDACVQDPNDENV